MYFSVYFSPWFFPDQNLSLTIQLKQFVLAASMNRDVYEECQAVIGGLEGGTWRAVVRKLFLNGGAT